MKIGSVFVALYLLCASVSYADYWNLPKKVTTQNTTVQFEVDSTWHLVEGNVKNLSGDVWLANPKDQKTVRAHIVMPIASFDTDNSSRDEKLKTVMHSAAYPEVIFDLDTDLPLHCSSTELPVGEICRESIEGRVSISGVSKRLPISLVVTKRDNDFQVSGDAFIRWEEFGVEDPSILIAKLDPTVKVNFQISLAGEKN